jgi:hypothetical protein
VWQKTTSSQAPVNQGTVAIANGAFSYNFAPYTVTTFVLPANALWYEAESLPVASYSGTDVRVVSDSRYSGGEGVILDATAVGNYVTFTVAVPAAGTYAMTVGVKDMNTRGIFQFSSNGTNHGSPQDEYTSAETFKSVNIGNVVFSSSGNKAFEFLVTGKNSSSSGYSLAFDYISLVPQ